MRRFSALLCLFLAAAILLSGCKPNKAPPASSGISYSAPIIPDDADGIIELYKEYLMLSEYEIQCLVESDVPREEAEIMDRIDMDEWNKKSSPFVRSDPNEMTPAEFTTSYHQATLASFFEKQSRYMEKIGIPEDYMEAVLNEFHYDDITSRPESEVIEMYHIIKRAIELGKAYQNFLIELKQKYEQLDLQ